MKFLQKKNNWHYYQFGDTIKRYKDLDFTNGNDNSVKAPLKVCQSS